MLPMQCWCLINNWCHTRYLSKTHPRRVLSRKFSLHVRLKRKVYLKLLRSHKDNSTKTAVHTINNTISKILEKHSRKSPLSPKRSFTENESPTGIPQVYLKLNNYFKENPWLKLIRTIAGIYHPIDNLVLKTGLHWGVIEINSSANLLLQLATSQR